jgi:hypothetical protein
MLNAKRKITERVANAFRFCCKFAGPGGIVWSDDDHRVRRAGLV